MSVVDTVLRLDPRADRAIVAAVARQLTADPSRFAALRADLAAHPEYLTHGSTRSREVTQDLARALFAVGVRGVALPLVRLDQPDGGAAAHQRRRRLRPVRAAYNDEPLFPVRARRATGRLIRGRQAPV